MFQGPCFRDVLGAAYYIRGVPGATVQGCFRGHAFGVSQGQCFRGVSGAVLCLRDVARAVLQGCVEGRSVLYLRDGSWAVLYLRDVSGAVLGRAVGMFEGLRLTLRMFQVPWLGLVQGPCFRDVSGAVLYHGDVSGAMFSGCFRGRASGMFQG
eukprot:9503093-Pyramimonas_sp.AAC.1